MNNHAKPTSFPDHGGECSMPDSMVARFPQDRTPFVTQTQKLYTLYVFYIAMVIALYMQSQGLTICLFNLLNKIFLEKFSA